MSSDSITTQLSEQFTRNIREGIWQVDQKIPTEMELMRRYKVGRNTIRAALQQLEKKQWIKATPGVGRSITPKAMTTRGLMGMLIRGGELGGGQGQRFHLAAKQHAQELGYQLATFHIDFEHNTIVTDPGESDVMLDLKAIDSAIVYSRHYVITDILNLAGKMPVATAMTHNIAAANVYSYYIDYASHIAMAVRHLMDNGIDHYAMLRFTSIGIVPFHSEIIRGFEMANYLCDRPVTPDMYLDWRSEITTSKALYDQWASMDPRPAAMISHLEQPLLSLQKELVVHGVPEEAHPLLICLADLSTLSRRNIAYFEIDIEGMARDSVNALHLNMTGQGEAFANKSYFGRFTLR